MANQLLIYSADKTRGGILKKVFHRLEVQAVTVDKLSDLKSTVEKINPSVIVIDTRKSIQDEITYLQKWCGKYRAGTVIVIGEWSSIKLFPIHNKRKRLNIADPFDPEQITRKAREYLFSDNQTAEFPEKEVLENDLKQFLKLE